MDINARKAKFREEFGLIKNVNMKRFFILMLERFPDYFFDDCPASSSGKYHPPRLRKKDGTYLHTKLVIRIIIELADACDLSQRKKEALIVAAACHDMYKQGYKKSGHTTASHPDLAAKAVKAVYRENPRLIPHDLYMLILDSIKYHYGRWGTHKMSPIDTGVILGLLHIADMIAARLHIIVKRLGIFRNVSAREKI